MAEWRDANKELSEYEEKEVDELERLAALRHLMEDTEAEDEED